MSMDGYNTIYTKDGKGHFIMSFSDFEQIVEEYMGTDAVDYLQNYITLYEDEEDDW